MRKLMPFFLCILLLIGCQKTHHPLDSVSQLLDTDVTDFKVITYYDTHGGFHGDGETVIIMELTQEQAQQLKTETNSHPLRREIPFSAPIETALYGGTVIRGGVEWGSSALFIKSDKVPLVPEIEDGFYLFRDRHGESTDPGDASNLHTRGSWNFDLAVFDADSNTLYYLVLDT